MASLYSPHKWLLVISLTMMCLSLTACITHQEVAHRGLSSDGYGFVANGPVLAPPEHLTQHQGSASH
ncbi:hypothetical protein BG621_05005 [Parasaccharibacter apium]|nr:hypothetical protein BG621_05005 [Parasaccharibacter apium]